MNNRLFIPLVAVFVLGGCTVTGPADDGYDNSNEWVDNGRLLSDDSSGYTIYSSEKKTADDSAVDTGAESISDSELDLAAYREWLDARESNSAEYRKFRRWQEFEEFRRWQEQKSQQ